MAPSEDLVDEVEAINSIYGEGTLVLDDDDVAVLALPSSAADVADADDAGAASRRLSLRLRFPPGYPVSTDPPSVLGVQSVGEDGHRQRPGAAARDADLFRAAMDATFQQGQVCLFDAVEEFMRWKAEEAEAEAEAVAKNERLAGFDYGDDDDDNDCEGRPRQRPPTPELPPEMLDPPPPWIVSERMEELKSVFVARCAPVSSPAQAAAYLQHLLATDRRVRTAAHNMTAWRIRGIPSSTNTTAAAITFQDCDDDGETAAGGRLLHLMQLMDIWNVMVVVTRWWGGHKLGPHRFALINQAARDAFVRAGLVPEPTSKKKGHGK
ncbi:impact family protein [Grosmannia clavigera kw1407]|uniref:Impact family protein n=1 Tax=Grosmannia clavigera (strain kw1407 / UAMH 11150) TaxID=655863 RepID=F0XIK0_GROCL|nr:impact family protein [Grosmannia clavigera kw1407]EFX02512.1 impact family protein [Grosmannia clavigera kw1407]